MKTQNNITSRIGKLSFVILTALLFSYSVSMAGELPVSKVNTDTEFEAELKIEEWMSNLDAWNSNASAEFVEEEIIIEEWMLNANSNFWMNTDSESEILIEDWMLNASYDNWNTNLDEEKEEEIVLEKWMENLNEWN